MTRSGKELCLVWFVAADWTGFGSVIALIRIDMRPSLHYCSVRLMLIAVRSSPAGLASVNALTASLSASMIRRGDRW